MLSFKRFLAESEQVEEDANKIEQHLHDKLHGAEDYEPIYESEIKESVEEIEGDDKKLLFRGVPHQGRAVGVRVPKHMWEGGKTVKGMKQINQMRAKVYGSERRAPLTKSEIHKIHTEVLEKHFSKPESEQIAAENGAIAKMRAAGHLSKSGLTTDKSEKTDTVNYETGSQGNGYGAVASKGVAGHAVYTSGTGENEEHHILRTCTGATKGCGGGLDDGKVADTSKGTCFAPKAEAQYAGASVKRACHSQAKHDPAMTEDWIIAHVGSLRKAASALDKKGKTTVFRPNIVDETDTTSRIAIKHLNKQRASARLPKIIGNGYGKTGDLHDPENGWYSTYSNTGPKVKNGRPIKENIIRDASRVKETVTAHDGAKDFTNDEGKKTPPKNSYMVINAKRNSPLATEFQKHVTHVKYWSKGREQHELSAHERTQGSEGHYDGNGNPTTPENAHYGHTTVNGRRYDYQKQHVLHPRMVDVPVRKKGKTEIHSIPTDSRFKDDDYLPKDSERYKSPNGKNAGGILATTPTLSTTDAQHHSEFTHHVDENTIKHAKQNNGEYEIDNPHEQEKSRIMGEYEAPTDKSSVKEQPITINKKK